MGAENRLSGKNLPTEISVQDFDTLHDDTSAWRDTITVLANRVAAGLPVHQMEEGTVLVALLGREQVIKLYPPFLRDHFEFERAALAQLQGQISVPTPALLASGEHQGWPYVLMSQLRGVPLVQHWAGLDSSVQCRALEQIGALMNQVHALPVGGLIALAPPWGHFIAQQRQRCQGRQQRTGLPAHLLAQLDLFLDGEPAPQSPVTPQSHVILTGEYTPMNLMFDEPSGQVCGMFDFGDGLVGPREVDWLGPLCFLAAGKAGHVAALLAGLQRELNPPLRRHLLRLLLLHRYSNLKAQLALPAWQECRSFEELAERLWP
jgi:hygromycin-B 7''-O-kinase